MFGQKNQFRKEPFFWLGFLRKRKQQISKEIPKRGGTHSEDLAEVEIPFQLAVEQPDRGRVDAQTDQGDDEILGVFRPDLRVGALESPEAVEDIVGGGGENEAEDVAQIFVPFEPFLASVGNAEIDEYARKSHHAEFQEFQQKLTG